MKATKHIIIHYAHLESIVVHLEVEPNMHN